MLLIGFVWVLLATFVSVCIKAVLPGRWEDHGPTLMVVVGAGSSLTAITGLLVMGMLDQGFDGWLVAGPPSGPQAMLGIGLSLVGGLGSVGAYIVDVRKRQKSA